MKCKEIHIAVIATEIFLLLGFHLWQRSLSLADILGAVIVGILFIIVSVVTDKQIGIGDALIFLMTGFGLGIMANIFIIILSFILAFVAAVFLIVVKHISRNYQMPFAPFILGSFIFYVVGIYV